VRYPLAIFAPLIGVRSETFIRRRIENLLPGGTVVVTETVDGPLAGHWSVSCPMLVLNKITRPPLVLRAGLAMARRLGWSAPPHGRAVKAFVRAHGVRVVIGDYLNWSLRWIDLARDLGVRFYGYAHGYDVSRVLRDQRWCKAYGRYNQTDGVIVPSRHSRDRLVAVGLDSETIHVVPSGVPVPSAPIVRGRSAAVRCLAVGRMVRKKAPLLTLEAFQRALRVHPDLTLDVVGDGELLPPVVQFVRDRGLEGKVTLHGGQPNEVVERLMREADMFLQHSVVDSLTGDEEGLPTAIQEAMAHGLPVVSTYHAGIPEAVDDGATGYLVDEGDTASMADRIVRLARDRGLRHQMGEAAWEKARERFSWEKSREALLGILGIAS
jgi:glycosyltransferase involved in cell wall biosynthesis